MSTITAQRMKWSAVITSEVPILGFLLVILTKISGVASEHVTLGITRWALPIAWLSHTV